VRSPANYWRIAGFDFTLKRALLKQTRAGEPLGSMVSLDVGVAAGATLEGLNLMTQTACDRQHQSISLQHPETPLFDDAN
jgi:hypothetical protein